MVNGGIRREFWRGVAGILSEASVAQFGSKVDWAPVVTPPATLSRSVSIDSEAVDLVKAVANRLRQQKVDPNQIFSGTIVQLRHEDPNDPFGEIAVSTMRRGRQSEVLVRLPLAFYGQAWECPYASL